MEDSLDDNTDLHNSIHNTTKSNLNLSLPTTTNPPGPANPPKQKVWLVFGATGHLGRSVTKAAFNHGDIVSAVGRTHETSPKTMQSWYASTDRYLGLLCDIRLRETVQLAFQKTIKRFGRVDVIANCAGYGVIGSCEDQDEHEIRNQFNTNFMGTLNVIHASLTYFRERQEGRYLILSSTSGALGVPGMGPYCASKYAVEGLIESMLYEVDQFNIKLTLIEPGHLRQDDLHTQTDGQKLPLYGHFKVAKSSEPYQSKDSPAAHAHRILQWIGDSQATSTVKAAELVWQLGHCSYPPLRLLLGTFAVESVRDRLKSIIEEIEDWKHLNYPPIDDHDAEDMDPDNDNEDGPDHEQENEGDRRMGSNKDNGNGNGHGHEDDQGLEVSDDDVDEDDDMHEDEHEQKETVGKSNLKQEPNDTPMVDD